MNGTLLSVCATPSKAASLTGWFSATVRPAQSPTGPWQSVAKAAKLSATTSPVRW